MHDLIHHYNPSLLCLRNLR